MASWARCHAGQAAVDGVEGGALAGIHVVPVVVGGPADQPGQRDHGEDGCEQGQGGGAQGAHLDPLRAQDPGLGDRCDLDVLRRGVLDDRAHAAGP